MDAANATPAEAAVFEAVCHAQEDAIVIEKAQRLEFRRVDVAGCIDRFVSSLHGICPLRFGHRISERGWSLDLFSRTKSRERSMHGAESEKACCVDARIS